MIKDKNLKILESPIEVKEKLNSFLRGLILPPKNNFIFTSDLKSIEARLTFWFCGSKKGIQAYNQGKDIYQELGNSLPIPNFSVQEKRQLGKQLILGKGYGMGFDRFKEILKHNQIFIQDEIIKLASETWKNSYPEIPNTWKILENNLKYFLSNKLKKHSVKLPFCEIVFEDESKKIFTNEILNYTSIKLPSGRKLFYPEMFLKEDKICYSHIDRKKRTIKNNFWGGTILENVIQGLARDVIRILMLEISKNKNFQILFTEHDSITVSCRDKKYFKDFEKIMNPEKINFCREIKIQSDSKILQRNEK